MSLTGSRAIRLEQDSDGAPSLAGPLRLGALAGGAVCLAGVVAATGAARAVGHPSGSPLTAPGNWNAAWWAGIIGAFLGYAGATAALGRANVGARTVFVVAALIQAVPLAAPLLLSGDVYAYLSYGASGDPYGAFGHLSDVYGPLWTGVARLAVHLGGSTYLLRGLAFVSVMATTAMAAAVARRRAAAAAFVGWNPLVAIHFSGGGHLDAFMMALALGGILLGRAGRPELAGASWVASIFVKWVTAPLYALWLIDEHRRRRPVGRTGPLLAVIAMLALAYALYDLTWLHAFSLLRWQERQPFSFGFVPWLRDAGLGTNASIVVSNVAEVAAFVVFAIRARRRPVRLGLAAGTLMLLSPRFQPSYLIWCIALAACDDDDRWGRVLAVVMTAVLLSDALSSVLNA